MTVTRVERHCFKKTDPSFELFDNYCFMSKNLYNFANYQIRQEYIKNNRYIDYNRMDKLMKEEGMSFDYRNMPTAQSAQQTLRLLEQNWKSFFASSKDYSKDPEKYTGRPKLPKYLPKDGRYVLTLTNSNCKIKAGSVHFPKVFNGLTLETKVTGKLQQVRVLSKNEQIVIEVVYTMEVSESKADNGRYMSIDIGLDNLAAVASNTEMKPVIINGKGLKSINKYYNKQKSHYQETAKRMNGKDYTKRMNSLTTKRNNRINDYMHKASKYIVELAVRNKITVIVIGNNKDWKRGSFLSKKTNQTFVGVPHQKLIEKIMYKAENVGIQVVVTEESYTSGTSYLDNELPKKENYDKSRRKHRGLFISNSGIKINADINGSLQILKKVFPGAYGNGILGVGLHPVVVNVA